MEWSSVLKHSVLKRTIVTNMHICPVDSIEFATD